MSPIRNKLLNSSSADTQRDDLADSALFLSAAVSDVGVFVRGFDSNLISSDRISEIYQKSSMLHVSSQICWCSIPADGHHGGSFSAALIAER